MVIGKPGPFQIIDDQSCASMEKPVDGPRRRYDCANYEKCLNLAAALNWDNFTCRGCSGEVNETLYWRAYQAMKKDNFVKEICELPNIHSRKVEQDDQEDVLLRKRL